MKSEWMKVFIVYFYIVAWLKKSNEQYYEQFYYGYWNQRGFESSTLKHFLDQGTTFNIRKEAKMDEISFWKIENFIHFAFDVFLSLI